MIQAALQTVTTKPLERRSADIQSAPRSFEERLKNSRDAAVAALLQRQDQEGWWCAELEGDSILQSEYILLKFIIHQEDDARLPKIATYLREQQRQSDGAWIQYPGSRPDLSATVKGYLALKLMGDDPQAPHMVQARELILRLGGAERCNTYSKFYLAALGQMPWDSVPAVPPEFILAPKWFFFHIDKVSAWTRTMIMPLSIVSHYRPVREISEEQGIRELYSDPVFFHKPKVGEYDKQIFTWKNFFLMVDWWMKRWERTKMLPFRQLALRRVEQWILKHTDPARADGMGAIFPPMVYNLIAFRLLGYDPEGEFLTEAQRQLDRFMIEEDDSIRLQPCFSPVWDTGIGLYALTEAGLRADRADIAAACQWLLSKECREPGDWVANVKGPVEPSGWYFEFNNAFYPDVDDTAMVTMALIRSGCEEAKDAVRRAHQWILAMQNDDGGWAAFDRTCHRPLLEAIPFADHNAMQDPSCPDITGRVLESLGHGGYRIDHPAVRRAVEFLKMRQEEDGSWFGRWGVNYIYGAWEVLCGLENVGVDMSEPWVRRAGDWLLSVQKPDGSFGETADSYEDAIEKYEGESTASQTAWGAMGLMAVFGAKHSAVECAMTWLSENQNTDGTWTETLYTGTGFPKVFYLKYHLYSLYFPVMAMSRYLKAKPLNLHAFPEKEEKARKNGVAKKH